MNFENKIVESTSTLRDAMIALNSLSGGDMTLLVVDNKVDMQLRGTLTNGDVRRALLDGRTLADSVLTALNSKFKYISDNDTDELTKIRSYRKAGILTIPIVDCNGRITDILDLNTTVSRLPVRAVLMAGGKGERLRPLTLDTPKPLLEIDGKAIIDYNIEALVRVGIRDITVCTRYMADRIKRHFDEPVAGVRVKCVTEERAMGTVGAVSLVDIPEHGDTLIMNSDLLTTISFEDMYIKHRTSNADVTVGVVPYQVSVPFAILTTEGEKVTSIEEKPSYSHYANGGVYLFDNKLLKTVSRDVATDAPDLIRQAIDAGLKVTYYVIDGTWIDIGSPTDFRQAAEMMRHHRNLTREF